MSRNQILFRMAGFALLCSVVGCAAMNVSLPSVTEQPTDQHHPGKVIWRDLITDRPAESRRFYEELFGWEFESVGNLFGLGGNDAYTLISHDGRLIGGMVDANRLDNNKEISQWVVLVSVSDIDRAVKIIADGGGTVFTPPTDVAQRGRIAVVADPQGAALALLETRDGDPPDRDPGYGDFLWDELWTGDVSAATRFYRDVAGYEINDVAVDGAGGDSSYRVLEHSGEPRAGLMQNPFEAERPVWVSYIRVKDPAAITARVEELGGKIYIEAQERPIGGEVAFIGGPSGAGIALQTWPLENQE